MKQKNLIISVFLLVTVLLSFSVSASGGYVHDDADVLTYSEEIEVKAQLERTGISHGLDIAVVTAENVSDYELESYADDYYDYHGYGDDGVLILVVPETGLRYISTCGDGIDIVDPYLGSFTDKAGYLFDSRQYAEAFTECALLIDELAEYDDSDNEDIGRDSRVYPNIFVNLIIGFVVAFIVTGVMKGNLKSVRMQSMASNYMKNNSLNITRSNDIFLYRNITRRAKPKNNSSSGGGTHRSSSGRSHGGGRF